MAETQVEPFCTAAADLPSDRIAIQVRVLCGHPSEPEQWGARVYLSPLELRMAQFDKIEAVQKNMYHSLLSVIPQRLISEMAPLIEEAMKPLRGQINRLLEECPV